MIRRCWLFPHCACGITLSNRLADEGQKMLIYRDRSGTLKRVPVSEVLTFAVVEEVYEDQYGLGCPKHPDYEDPEQQLADQLEEQVPELMQRARKISEKVVDETEEAF